ncbi:MAG: hypothetical protein NTV99_04790 [Deltaproteobacteria bacterium]|nr:hypothetical protein [Deltaproteobacteria bacterium]
MNYEDWLETQSEHVQKDVLGKVRWEMWRKRKIGIADMIHQDGRPLTIEELKSKIAKE